MNAFRKSLTGTAALTFALVTFTTVAQEPDADPADTSIPTAEAADQPEPLTFPREVTSDVGTVLVYAPQIDSWDDFAKIEGRIAIGVTPAGETEPVYGVAEFTADSDPNLELRVVAVENLAITVTSFPEPDAKRREQLDAIVRETAQYRTHFVPLDVILTYIAPNAQPSETEGLAFEPPPIFYSSTPAILVMTEAEPLYAPLPDTKLEYVVNTNWDLFRYKEKEWYLRVDYHWLKNKSLSGEWEYTKRLPRDFNKLPDDKNWTKVKAAMPPTKPEKGDEPPTVFISDRPAELIVTDGQPGFRTVGGPGLSYATDTESDLFRYGSKYYYLVSGRWFRADSLRGPWEHAKELPEVFATIPEDHEKSHVLVAVPNSDEARLAMLEALIPRKATVSRDAGKDVNVFFQGDPQFELIPGTTVERATNSYNDILRVGNQYYLCDNAVWYVAASTDGPWVVADSIPVAIYDIPPSSPSYHVTHVKVYDSDPSSVSMGYTSGYYGSYVSYGVVVYGSGWYYPPYYGYYPYYGYPYYPYYWGYPYSYGGSTWYNPNTGRYGRSASVYGPYGGYGRSASYNPRTGTYARGEAVWDSNEIAGRGVAYNPRTGTGVATRGYDKNGKGWGESLITHNDKWVATQSEWGKDWKTTELVGSEGGTGTIERRREGDTVYGAGEFERGGESLTTRSARNEQGTIIAGQTGSGEQGIIGRSAEGDLYAGKDGSVYRRDDNGWHQNTGDGWNHVDVPDDRAAQIDQRRSDVSTRRDSLSQSIPADRQAQIQERAGQARSQRSTGSFADSYRSGGSDWSNRTYDSTRSRSSLDGSRRSSLDGSRRSDLNRSHNARSQGYQRYNNRRAGAGSYNRTPRSRPAGRRRR